MQEKYVTRNQNDVPFSFESCDLSVEKIVELVGSVILTDEHSSSDEDLENSGILPIMHETSISDESLPHQYKKKFTKSSFDAIVLVSSEKKFLCCEDNLYHLSTTNVKKLVECVKHFTYVPETDEIIYTNNIGGFNLYRKSILIEEPAMLFFTCNNHEERLCTEHAASNYLTILSETIQFHDNKSSKKDNFVDYHLRFIDEMGCLTKPIKKFVIERKENLVRVKNCLSSFVEMSTKSVLVREKFAFSRIFSYSGSRGNNPSWIFSPSDACTDPHGNFLVIDCHDDTVHLLDPMGKFLRIIMSTEDELSGITRISMDTFGWLWMGCKDGMVHFANYQHFKSTTRRDRYLEKQKNKESA